MRPQPSPLPLSDKFRLRMTHVGQQIQFAGQTGEMLLSCSPQQFNSSHSNNLK